MNDFPGVTFVIPTHKAGADLKTVPALKQAEDNEDMIARCVESSGLKTTATIDLKFAGQKSTGTFGPDEIKTLRIHLTTRAIKEINLLEE